MIKDLAMPLSKIGKLHGKQPLMFLFSLVLIWPALVNGYPFLFPDTSAYVRSVDAVSLKVFSYSTVWTNEDVVSSAARVQKTPISTGIAVEVPTSTAKPVLLGRSIIYGILPYLAVLSGSMWACVVIQVLFCGFVLLLLLRHFIDPYSSSFLFAYLSLCVVVALTPLSYFACMIMPDVFTGTTVLAGAVLVSGWQRETQLGKIGWITVASIGALTHSTHILILVGITLFGLIYLSFGSSLPKKSIAVVACVCLLGIGFEAAFSLAVGQVTGTPPIRPPFLTARLTDGGPGKRFLDQNCFKYPLVICMYKDRLPLPSDEFLWRTDNKGIFKAVSVTKQRSLATEQFRFAGAVLAYDPIGTLSFFVKSVFEQLGLVSLREFNGTPASAKDITDRLPSSYLYSLRSSKYFSGSMPLLPVNLFIYLIAFSIALLSVAKTSHSIKHILVVALAGWIIDVIVCGTLSTPHDRYQARVIWVLLVLAAGSLVHRYFFQLAERRKDGSVKFAG